MANGYSFRGKMFHSSSVKESDMEEAQLIFKNRGTFTFASDDEGASENESLDFMLSPSPTESKAEDFVKSRPKTSPSLNTKESIINRPKSQNSDTFNKPVVSVSGKTTFFNSKTVVAHPAPTQNTFNHGTVKKLSKKKKSK